MELKKSHRANLDKRKAANFAVGLIISLSLVLISFEWTTKTAGLSDLSRAPEIPFINEMMEITRRDEVKPPPRPELPSIVETIQLVEDNIELEEVDFSSEVTRDTRVDLTIYSDPEPEVVQDEVERYFVEIMPTFNGGDPRVEFSRFIASKMRYPADAAQNGIQGRVYIKFVVNSQGELENVEIYRGVHPDLDNEALRVIKNSPLWEPGIQSGRKVSVTYIFPINFLLHH
jgi:periplasmic protein TonB